MEAVVELIKDSISLSDNLLGSEHSDDVPVDIFVKVGPRAQFR